MYECCDLFMNYNNMIYGINIYNSIISLRTTDCTMYHNLRSTVNYNG